MTAQQTQVESPAGAGPGGRAVVAALLLAAFGASLAQTVVVAALPSLQADLGTSSTGVAWVLTSFMLASAISVPIAGRLGDARGYRRVLVGCLASFAVGALVAALGTHMGSLGVLVTGRVLQGLAGGVFPLAMGIVRSSVAPARIPQVVAVLSAMFGVGGSAGMVIAGPLVEAFGTESLSWLTLVLAAAALAGVRFLPAGRGVSGGRIDLVGAVILSGALVCLLLAISEGNIRGWKSAGIISLFAAAVVLLAVFAVVELRSADPLIDLRLLKVRAFAAANLIAFIIGAAMFGSITLIPRFVETPEASGYGFTLSAAGAGLVMLPVGVFTLIASPLSGRLTARFGPRLPLCVGAGCAAVAFAWLAAAHGSVWDFYLTGVLVGAGYGLAFAALGNLVVASVEPRHTGVAVGVNTIVRTVGGALGAQIASALLVASPSRRIPGLPDVSGYTHGFVLFAFVAVAALVATLAMPRRVGEASPEPETAPV
ncbi:MFS transporter [Streptomyces sp. NPDC023723]|uniref:MFS transporter n=1 Tax=Streptomyces sp. NPDC023723 TaxID=3154323 RepID=UPI0033C4FDB1